MKNSMNGLRAALPQVGTEFRIGGMTYVVTYTDKRRFSARPKDPGGNAGRPGKEGERRGGGNLMVASIFDPDDWADEYQDGRQLLDPEPEEWGWRYDK